MTYWSYGWRKKMAHDEIKQGMTQQNYALKLRVAYCSYAWRIAVTRDALKLRVTHWSYAWRNKLPHDAMMMFFSSWTCSPPPPPPPPPSPSSSCWRPPWGTCPSGRSWESPPAAASCAHWSQIRKNVVSFFIF